MLYGLFSLVLPGSGEALQGRWGAAAFSLSCAGLAWIGAGHWAGIVFVHLGSAWVATCYGLRASGETR